MHFWVTSLGFLVLFGWTRAQSPDPSEQESRAGQKIFEVQCLSCHARDCKGKAVRTGRFALGGVVSAPDLTTGDWSYGSGQLDSQKLVAMGKGKMPPFEKKLSEDEIRDVVRYMRRLCGVDAEKTP